MYTAEVKVVQRQSSVPEVQPQHSLLDLMPDQSKAEKRKSMSFNMAAKGFGTYNDNIYKSILFAD